jgi:microcystin-dependent protein
VAFNFAPVGWAFCKGQVLSICSPQATTTGGSAVSPAGALWAESGTGDTIYQQGSSNTTMAAQTIGNTGGGAAHANCQRVLALNYIIALVGIFPSRN